jgi:ligand-binding sensor domain-containing protein
MNRSRIPALLCIFAIGLAVTSAAPTPILFTAAAFTKAQKNSSIPTDAGIFVRDPVLGWMPFGPKIQSVASAAVDPSDASRIFLACGNGIVRSLDSGATWRLVTDWRISDVTAIVINPTDGQTIYAASGWGLARSQDGGETWQSIDHGLTEKFSRTIMIDPANPQRLLVGTAGGLFVSTDGADTWQRIESVPATHVLRLRHGEQQPQVWLAVTEGRGAWLSNDSGHAWAPTAPAVAEANLYAAAVDPTNAQNLAVGGWNTGVHTSIDGGKTWQHRPVGLPSENVLTLAYDPSHEGRLWVGTFEEGTAWTDDAGQTWHDGGLDGSLTNDLGFLPLVPVAR